MTQHTYKGLPLIEFLVNPDKKDNTGMNRLSFVENPAIQLEWNLFKSIENNLSEIKDEDKRLITSPIMLANTPILREINNNYFYCTFPSETILEMMKKYFIQNKIHNINEDHNPKKIINGIYMIESFIIGDRVKSELYPNIPEGSWVATFYVEDKEYWDNNIKNGHFTGVSLEGVFDLSNDDILYNIIEQTLSEEISYNEQYNIISKLFQ